MVLAASSFEEELDFLVVALPDDVVVVVVLAIFLNKAELLTPSAFVASDPIVAILAEVVAIVVDCDFSFFDLLREFLEIVFKASAEASGRM